MAFNWQTFRTRTLTAVIFVAIMLAGLLWNQWSFLVLFSIIHFGCWWEFLKIIEKIHKTSFHTYTKLGLMVMGYGFMLWFCSPDYHINHYELKENLSLPVSAAGFALLLIGIFQKVAINQRGFVAALTGFIYISLSWGLLINLRYAGVGISCDNGGSIGGALTTINFFIFPFVIIPLTIIISLWINDTMAYIMGSLIGKTPLSKISPKKTWEGTISGILFSIIITGLIFSNLNPEIAIRRFHYDFSNYVWYIVAGISAIFGTFGDLFESKLKRMADVKDSGTLMPGHGGFLDRFDSLLLATPFVWLYVQLFIQ